MKTKKMAAIIFAAMCAGLSSCVATDNPVAHTATDTKSKLVGTWCCEYDAVGTAKSDYIDESQDSIIQEVDSLLGKTVELEDGTTITFEEPAEIKLSSTIDYVHVIDVYEFYESGLSGWRRYFFREDNLLTPGMVWGDLGLGAFDYTMTADGQINITRAFDFGQEYPMQWTANFTNNQLTGTGANGQPIIFKRATEEQTENFGEWSSMLTPSGGNSQERAILNEVNLCRTNPSNYAEKRLKPFLKLFTSEYTAKVEGMNMMMNGGKQEVQQAIADVKKMKPLKALKWNDKLWKAAQYHCKDLGPKNLLGHTSSNGESAAARIKRFSGKSYSGECISFGFSKAQNIVIQLVVDFGYPRGMKAHRDIIMSAKYKEMGAAIGKHGGYRHMSTLDFTN